MDSVSVPFLPASLWVLAVATTIVVLLVMFGLYTYYRRRMRALLQDSAEVAHLAAQIDLLQAQKDELVHWMQDQKVELDRLQVEREEQERLRAELDRLEQECLRKDQENQALRNEVGELENQRHMLGLSLEKLERDIEGLERKKTKMQSIENRLSRLQAIQQGILEDLTEKRNDLRDVMRILAENKANLEVLFSEKSSLESKIAELKTLSQEAQQEAEENRRQAHETKVKATAEKDNLENIQNQLRRSKEELFARNKDIEIAQQAISEKRNSLNELAAKQLSLEHIIEELQGKIELTKGEQLEYQKKASEAKIKVEKAERELDNLRGERSQLEIHIGSLQAKQHYLEREIEEMEEQLEDQKPHVEGDHALELKAYTDLFNVCPECLNKEIFSDGEMADADEIQALQNFKNRLRDENLKFSPRIIDAFHTSLKCHNINPLTVLAGVSGTGKTLLPIYYARMLGMHCLTIAVQPRWDSPQDMFGFYNYLEKEYKATDLSRALIRMDPYNYTDDRFGALDCDWMQDRMLLVLLDEMNLARTEYYFSEFLSKLELRRLVKDPSKKSDRQQAEIALDTGPGKSVQCHIWVGDNILFVGTMNEDETTQTLSDKVLDRANVLRFGKPDERSQPSISEGMRGNWSSKYLAFSQWKRWHKPFDTSVPWYEQVVTWTNSLNSALNRVGRPFGFRVQRSIGEYVANYPNVEEFDRYKLAFADQVELKIIPKLRGIDLGEEAANVCLDNIEAVIAELGDQELGDAFRECREESQRMGMFQWRGVSRSLEEGD